MKLCECGCGEPAPIARGTDRRTGAIKGQPQRFVKGHSNRLRGAAYFVVEDRGYATPCRVWQGATAGSGYGVRLLDGRRVYVHRAAWEQANGRPVPAGFQVLHRCDVPPCAEPTHLFLGTAADNVADCIAKGRAVPPPRSPGEANARARLTVEQVREIRAARGTNRGLAKQLGIPVGTIAAIRARRTWRIPEAEPEAA